MENYGTVQFDNCEVIIIEQPYLDGEFYKAVGVDAEENEFLIKWPVVDMDCMDESDACDWEDYQIMPI